MADAQLSVELQANVRNFVNGMRSAGQESTRTATTVEKSARKISSAIGSQLLGVFSVGAVIGFGKAVLDVTAQFQKFEAVLGNTLGSSALASLKLKEIQDFAAQTPFAVNELTGAFVKLANSGFKPTGDQMRALGDLASSTGKSFDQLAEAILDAQSGEFERLKEFGVRAKDAGDKVIFTYKGVQTQVEKSSEAIRNYITDLGNAEGVSGSMAKISQTLGGQISNLGDAWDQMLLSVGGNTEGVFKESIGFISAAINKVTEFNKELEIASRYKIGSATKDFFETLYKYSAGGLLRGAPNTSKENKVSEIIDAQNSVSAFATKAITAAKNTADFGKALAALKIQGDKALKGISDPGVLKGVSDAYQLGVKAIQDARNNFGSATTAAANFGTGAKKSIKAVTKAVNELKAAQSGLPQLIGSTRDSVSVTPNEGTPSLVGNKVSGVLMFDTIKKEQDRIKELQRTFNDEMSNLIQSGLSGTINGVAQGIGEALANGGNVFAAAGKGLIDGFSNFLSQFGKLLVEYGAAAVLKSKLDAAILVPGAGIFAGAAAIVAGIALQVAAAAFGGMFKGSSKGTPQQTAFANGGIVYGPTNALVGEYSGARNNPEVIAPLSKLKSMIGENNQQVFIAESRIVGQDIVTSYRKASASMGRTS